MIVLPRKQTIQLAPEKPVAAPAPAPAAPVNVTATVDTQPIADVIAAQSDRLEQALAALSNVLASMDSGKSLKISVVERDHRGLIKTATITKQ